MLAKDHFQLPKEADTPLLHAAAQLTVIFAYAQCDLDRELLTGRLMIRHAGTSGCRCIQNKSAHVRQPHD